MMEKISVSNIKCGGCANSIVKTLSKNNGVSNVDVNVEEGVVTWTANSDDTFSIIKKQLGSMGYPEGDPNILQTAKSYVSCAIGKMSNTVSNDN